MAGRSPESSTPPLDTVPSVMIAPIGLRRFTAAAFAGLLPLIVLTSVGVGGRRAAFEFK